jgi:acetyl-CoA C-acetyltransferase
MDGFYDLDGGVPCQVDGGLKCFGHPIGASGLRMLYEMYLQLLGRAGERQLENPTLRSDPQPGGIPGQNVCSISIIGRYGDCARSFRFMDLLGLILNYTTGA